MFLLRSVMFWPLLPIAALFIDYPVGFDFWGQWKWVMLVASAVCAYMIFYRYFMWRNEVLIITNQRIINNNQRGFFSKSVTELLDTDIMGISYEKSGFNASMYNYGDIVVRTASDNEMMIENIGHPSEIVETINKIRVSNKQADV